jgi:PEP-CTERM motif
MSITLRFDRNNLLQVCAALLLAAATSHASWAATLANATFDTDSYVFIGTNNEFQNGISTFTDNSGGVLDSLNNSHFNFGVIKFDDLSGIETVANGGPSKYLALETMQSGSGTFAFSVAGADIQNGYPTTSGSFNGPTGTADERLQWYFDNIKGDDATFGGYAGGADHIGVLEVAGGPTTYSLDVTAVVDAWLDGTVPNYGFGVWAVSTSAAQGADLDFASMENPITGGGYFGPRLTSIAVPEPASCAMLLVGIAGLAVRRSRFGGAAKLLSAVSLVVACGATSVSQAAVIPVVEDVMTSGFFTGTNLVRGYDADDRNAHRVSTDGAFGSVAAETVYLTFDPAQFAGFGGPVASAILTMQSTNGGFGGDASTGNPFTVSAHAVNADPLASITDDTNPGGPIDWVSFFNGNILPADPAALTAIEEFGPVTFDVTSVVNDWIAGTNTVFALAMTGKNDTSGNDFLHGFLNNSEAPGSTFLTVNVPEPTALVLSMAGLFGTVVAGGRRNRTVCSR